MKLFNNIKDPCVCVCGGGGGGIGGVGHSSFSFWIFILFPIIFSSSTNSTVL